MSTPTQQVSDEETSLDCIAHCGREINATDRRMTTDTTVDHALKPMNQISPMSWVSTSELSTNLPLNAAALYTGCHLTFFDIPADMLEMHPDLDELSQVSKDWSLESTCTIDNGNRYGLKMSNHSLDMLPPEHFMPFPELYSGHSSIEKSSRIKTDEDNWDGITMASLPEYVPVMTDMSQPLFE
jgi:hypothetical protein